MKVQIGTGSTAQLFGPILLTPNQAGTALEGTVADQAIFQAPATYSATLVLGASNGLSDVNANYWLVPVASKLDVTQEDAAVGYNGTTYFAVPPTQTTVNVPVSFTLQDATATGVGSPIYDPYAGDITKTGTVVISLNGTYVNSNGNTSNFNASCSPNPTVNAVLGLVDPTNGLPSTATAEPKALSEFSAADRQSVHKMGDPENGVKLLNQPRGPEAARALGSLTHEELQRYGNSQGIDTTGFSLSRSGVGRSEIKASLTKALIDKVGADQILSDIQNRAWERPTGALRANDPAMRTINLGLEQ